jgi:hypothetical protein
MCKELGFLAVLRLETAGKLSIVVFVVTYHDKQVASVCKHISLNFRRSLPLLSVYKICYSVISLYTLYVLVGQINLLLYILSPL